MRDALIFPALGSLYQALGPWVEALLRVMTGFILVPHGLRIGFGFFPNTGLPVTGSFAGLSAALEREGYRPGAIWAVLVLMTELMAGPMLMLGLFTRPAALAVFILLALSVVAHWRDGWFWNTLGIEYPLLWAACALYFLVHGGGVISLDRVMGFEF